MPGRTSSKRKTPGARPSSSTRPGPAPKRFKLRPPPAPNPEKHCVYVVEWETTEIRDGSYREEVHGLLQRDHGIRGVYGTLAEANESVAAALRIHLTCRMGHHWEDDWDDLGEEDREKLEDQYAELLEEEMFKEGEKVHSGQRVGASWMSDVLLNGDVAEDEENFEYYVTVQEVRRFDRARGE
jgi:hypothetical protein